jgi:hypothetical protein
MGHRIELLRADLEDELSKLEKLEKEFGDVAEKLNLPQEQVPTYDRGAIGYLLHSFYNMCENMFLLIARFFENDLGPKDWHRDLLKRMKLEIPGYRPRVIDGELYKRLDDFRSFRHKFRHSYSFELDWEKERAVAVKLPETAVMLRRQMIQFIESLSSLEA